MRMKRKLAFCETVEEYQLVEGKFEMTAAFFVWFKFKLEPEALVNSKLEKWQKKIIFVVNRKHNNSNGRCFISFKRMGMYFTPT
jgi:hypothetical protein